ncbi:MAG: SAM-dependent methyltransferase [Candidatus Gallimonas sp.]
MNKKQETFHYEKSKAYDLPVFRARMMGPNPVKLTEELMKYNRTPVGARVLDLGCGMGVTSVFLAEQYAFEVYAADLWNDPGENRKFFSERNLDESRIRAVKADATDLPFGRKFFDAVVCTDSYNYFGRDVNYLDDKLLPFLKRGGYVYLCIAGMKNGLRGNYPRELTLSWTEEQLDYIRDLEYWKETVGKSKDAEIVVAEEMVSNREIWEDWIGQDNDYARGDAKAIRAGACRYLNFLAFVLKKR